MSIQQDPNSPPSNDLGNTNVSAIDAPETNSKDVEVQIQNTDPAKTEVPEEDFGSMLMDGYDGETMSNMFGTELKLKSKDDYWKDEKVRDNFKKTYGDDDKTAEKFDLYYQGLEGRYSKYKQGNYDDEVYARSLSGTSLAGGAVDKTKNMASGTMFAQKEVQKTLSGAIQFDGEFYGPDKSMREAMTQKVQLTVGEDENGIPITEEYDLTPELREELESVEGFDGYAYDPALMHADIGYRGKGAVAAIIDGKIWDDVTSDFVDVKSDQIVSNWDLPSNHVLSGFLKGNGMAMSGLGYAKALLRSPINTAVEFLDILPQMARGVMGVAYGDKAKDKEWYKYFTSAGIQLKGYKTSLSDEGIKDGFFGSAEVFLGTVADVASQLLVGGGIGKMIKGVGFGGAAQGFGTKMALTMMASKDMYQEALENGFSEKEAGWAMGATVLAMYQANAYSTHIISGVEPSALKHFGKKFAKKEVKTLMDAFRKTAATKGESVAGKKLMENMAGGVKRLNSLMESAKDFVNSHDVWYSMVEEATEEILEELSSEGVRQMMNGYRALQGDDLQQMAVGKGRFKSYWDKGYWQELVDNLIVSGVAGGIGGPMGRVLHGGASVSAITKKSNILDYALAEGGTSVLREAIIAEADKFGYGPQGMTIDVNENTNAFIMNGSGKMMNDIAKETLLQDLLVVDSIVKEMGFDAKQIIDNDPDLKRNLEKTSLAGDLKKDAENMVDLLAETGIGTEVLNALSDGEIEEALRIANESQSNYRTALSEEGIRLDNIIQDLEDTKKILDDEAKGADGKGTAESKFTEEQQEELDKNKELLKETKDKENDPNLAMDKAKLNKIHAIQVNMRGIQNGSAAEKYYMEYSLHNDPVFGSRDKRHPKFARYDKNFFKNSLDSSRDVMNESLEMDVANYNKMLDNDKRIEKITMDNLNDIKDIFNNDPYMSKESVQHIEDLLEAAIANEAPLEGVKAYLLSDEYIDLAINAVTAKYDNLPVVNVSHDFGLGWVDVPSKGSLNDYVSVEFLDVVKSPDFRDIFKQYNAKHVATIRDISQVKMLHLDGTWIRKGSNLFMDQTHTVGKSDWANATHIDGTLDFISNTTKESILQNVIGVDVTDNYELAGDALFKISAASKVESSSGSDPNAVQMTKRVFELQNANVDAFILNGYLDKIYQRAGDSNRSGAQTVSLDDLKYIDIDKPELMHPHSLDWLTKEVKENKDGTFGATMGGDILTKIQNIVLSMDKNSDGSKFNLSAGARKQVEALIQSVDIRAAQRDVLHRILSGINPNSQNRMIHDIARFRKNTTRILGEDATKSARGFSQLDVHNYKQNTAVSDFINDFMVDAEAVSAAVKKVEKNMPLTAEETQLLNDMGKYTSQLEAREIMPASGNTPEKSLIESISTYAELEEAMEFMYATESLEQAKEILIGIHNLVDSNPFDPSTTNTTEHLKMRQKGIRVKYEEYAKASTSPLPFLIDFLDQNSVDIPPALQALYDKTVSTPGDDLITDADFVEAEKLLFAFYKEIPSIRRDLTDAQYESLIDKNNPKGTMELVLFGMEGDSNEFNIEVFFAKYTEAIKGMYKNSGQIPNYEQEQSALAINAFLGNQGEVQVAKGSAHDSTITLIVNGVAGAGKTHMVAKLGIGIAQNEAARKYGLEKVGVMYGSNHPAQIDNLKKGLQVIKKKSDDGKTFEQLVGTLQAYKSNFSDPTHAAVSEIDSSFLIVYDEATYLDTRSDASAPAGDMTLSRFQQLIREVNVLKIQKGLPPLKLILMGDTSQSGWKDAGSKVKTNIAIAGRHMNAIMPPRLDHSYRTSNKFLKEALDSIRHFEVDKKKKFKYGKQKDLGNKFAGVQVVSYKDNSFKSALEDTELAANIEEQIAKAKKDGTEFKVFIVPDNLNSIDHTTAIGKLIALYPDNIETFTTATVQGQEANYVITEFTDDYIGNFGTTAIKNDLSTDMYTLLSRARDFVKVVNSNNTTITSEVEPNVLAAEPDVSKEKNKEKLHSHIMAVYGDSSGDWQPNQLPGNTNPPPNGGGCPPPVFARGGRITGKACLIRIKPVASAPFSSASDAQRTKLIDNTAKTFGISAGTFNTLLKMDMNELIDMLNDPTPEKIDKLKYKTTRDLINKDNKKGQKTLLKAVKALQAIDEDAHRKAKSAIDTLVDKLASQHAGTLPTLEDKRIWADQVIDAIIADKSIEVNIKKVDGKLVASHELIVMLQDSITARIDSIINPSTQLNLFDATKTVYQDPTIEPDSKNNKPAFVEDKYGDLIKEFGSYSKLIDGIKDLEKKLSVNPNNEDALKKYNEIREIFKQGEKVAGLITDPILPDFSNTIDGVGGRVGSEDSDVSAYDGNPELRSLIHNAKQSQLATRGGTGKLRVMPVPQNAQKYFNTAIFPNLMDDKGNKKYENVNYSPDWSHAALFADDIESISLVGNGKIRKPYTNAMFVATVKSKTSDKRFHVALGKVFLGNIDRDMKMEISKNLDQINADLGITQPDRKITATDLLPGHDAVLEEKMFPSSHMLNNIVKAAGSAAGGRGVIDIPINKKEFLKATTLGAGKISNLPGGAHQSLEDLRKSVKIANPKTRISSVILINKSGLLKSIPMGEAFVLYTTNPDIQGFDDAKTVLGLLNTLTSNGGEFSKTQNSKHNIRTDIGILPLDSKKLGLNDLYENNYTALASGSKGTPVEHIHNKILSSTNETNRVARILFNLSKQLLGDPKTAAGIRPLGAKVDINTGAAISQLDGVNFFKTDLFSNTDKQTKLQGKIPEGALNDFVSKLTPPSGSLLDSSDLISSVMVPFLRNYTPAVNVLSGGKHYKAKYFSMKNDYTPVVRSASGEDVKLHPIENFSIVNMLGAINAELATRFQEKGMSPEEAQRAAAEYMKNLVLPVLSEVMASTDIYAKYAQTTDKGNFMETTLSNNKTVSSSVSFKTQVTGDTEFSKETNQHFFPAANIDVNKNIVETTASEIAYPGISFDAAVILNSLNGKAPTRDIEDRFSVEDPTLQEDLLKKLSRIKSFAVWKDGLEKADLSAVEKGLEYIDEIIDTYTPEYMKENGFSPDEINAYTSEFEMVRKLLTDSVKSKGGIIKSDQRRFDNATALAKKNVTDAISSTSVDIMETVKADLANNTTANSIDDETLAQKLVQEFATHVQAIDAAITEAEKSAAEIQTEIDGIPGIVFANEDVYIKLNEILDKIGKRTDDRIKKALMAKFEFEVKFIPGYNIGPVKTPGSVAEFYDKITSYLEQNGFTFADATAFSADILNKTMYLDKNDPLQMAEALAEVASTLLIRSDAAVEMRKIIKQLPSYQLKYDAEEEIANPNHEFFGENMQDKIHVTLTKKYIKDIMTAAYNRKFEAEVEKSFASKFLESLSNFMDKIANIFNSLSDSNLKKLHAQADSLVEASMYDPKKAFTMTPQKGFIEIDFQKAFDQDPTASFMMNELSQIPGTILTGSIALGAQGKVYRDANHMVHDLDWVNDTYTQEEMVQVIKTKFPNSQVANSFEVPTNKITIFLIPTDPTHQVSDLRYEYKGPAVRGGKISAPEAKDENGNWVYDPIKTAWYGFDDDPAKPYYGTAEQMAYAKSVQGTGTLGTVRPKLTGYTTTDKDGNFVSAYTNRRLEDGSRVESNKGPDGEDTGTVTSMIDFFTDQDPVATVEHVFQPMEGPARKVRLSAAESIFAAKFQSLRVKDIADFTNYETFKGNRTIPALEGETLTPIETNSGDIEARMDSSMYSNDYYIRFGKDGTAEVWSTRSKSKIDYADPINIAAPSIISAVPKSAIEAYNVWTSALKNNSDDELSVSKAYDKFIQSLNGGKPIYTRVWAGDDSMTDLSNMGEKPFTDKIVGKKVKFKSVEQAFHVMKIRHIKGATEVNDKGDVVLTPLGTQLFNDIQGAVDGKTALAVSRSWFRKYTFDNTAWDKRSSGVMYGLMKNAFDQNPKAKQLLINTGDRILTHGNISSAMNPAKDSWEEKFPVILTALRKQYQNTYKRGDNVVNGDTEASVFNILDLFPNESGVKDILGTDIVNSVNFAMNTSVASDDVINIKAVMDKMLQDDFKSVKQLTPADVAHLKVLKDELMPNVWNSIFKQLRECN